MKLPTRAIEKTEETTQAPVENTSKPFFFRRAGSVRESRSKTSSRNRERDKSKSRDSSIHNLDNSQPIATKPKGFKKILSKMRRANSGPIPQELQKGFVPFESDVPFLDWDADILCSWFDSM